MKKAIVLILLAILLVSPAVSLAISQEALSVRENVFRIECNNLDYGIVYGSGFAFHSTDANTYIATNYHVVEDAAEDSLYAISHNGARIEASIVTFDEDHDIAVLKVSKAPLVNLNNLTLYDGQDNLVGIDVYVLGYPGAGDVLLDKEAYQLEDITITNGIVSAQKEATLLNKLTTYLQTNAAINSGNSGGPMMNEAGEIIGISTLEILDSQGVFAAVSIQHLIALLEENSIPHITTSTMNDPGNSRADTPPEIIIPAFSGGIEQKATLYQDGSWTGIAIFGVTVLTIACLAFVLASQSLGAVTLAQILKTRSKGLAEGKVGKYVYVILTQLHKLHVLGKAHGNINPGNVFINSNDNIILGRKAHKISISKNNEYLPLEIFEDPTPTTGSDIYSTGMLAYKMLTLANPPRIFDRFQGSQRELITPDEANSDLAGLINTMATVDKAKRPQSADELIPSFEKYKASGSSEKNSRIGFQGKWAIAAALIILAIASGVFGATLLSYENRYQEAIAYLEANDYKNAEASVQGLNKMYRDTSSIQMLIDAGEKIQNLAYADALSVYNEIKSEEYDLFIKDNQYEYAVGLLKGRKPQEAKEILEHIIDYKNATAVITECDYQIALQYLGQGKLDDAEQLFETLAKDNYRDADDRLKEIALLRVILKIDELEKQETTKQFFDDAFAIMNELGTFKGSESKIAVDRCKDLIYRRARSTLDVFLDFINNLAKLSREGKLDEMNEHYNDEAWDSPNNIAKQFERLDGYADSAKYVTLCEIINEGNSQDTFDQLATMWDFTPVRSIIAGDSYLYYYFNGTWRGDGGAYLRASTAIPVWDTNIPWEKRHTLYWSDGIAYVVADADYYSEWDNKAFAVNIIDLNFMQLYCFKNDRVYNLMKQ